MQSTTQTYADMILTNGKIALQDEKRSLASAVAIKDGLFLAAGIEQDVMAYRGPQTQVIDAGGRTVIPGLNDSHIHVIRGGLSFNMELRWDGVPSLADALRMLKDQAARTPAPQWVRVVGGWTEFQFAEKRMPTLDEINAAAPDTPVFVLNLYGEALLNGAALRAVGYTKDTPSPGRTEIQKDSRGNPTGLVLAQPDAGILYATLAKGPKLGHDDQVNSTRHFMRELNRLGLTSCADAGGGVQAYPEDYQVIEELNKNGQLTMRFAYSLFTQHPGDEISDYRTWTETLKPLQGDDWLRMNGIGEMIISAAYDFEYFRQPQPYISHDIDQAFEEAIRLFAEKRWPFRLHATYDDTARHYLDIFEKVNRDVPFGDLRWFFDHGETFQDQTMGRIAALGGGIAVQNRMAFQGEYFVNRYGAAAAEQTPAIKKMMGHGLTVGAGTDATRVSSYNPFVSLYWLSTGKTVGGLSLHSKSSCLDRMEALRLYTVGSAWFSQHEGKKGAIMPGQFADLAVLSADYFSVPDEEIKSLTSVLTIVGGKIVYGAAEFGPLDPPLPPASPGWSPVAQYGGYGHWAEQTPAVAAAAVLGCGCASHAPLGASAGTSRGGKNPVRPTGLWGQTGCQCWAF